ncbi:MAG: hypothetical protein JWM11_310 [Planctomycetaceae bacterium]|nr:hypothetical protein [Planctomycetaceae bacterium]
MFLIPIEATCFTSDNSDIMSTETIPAIEEDIKVATEALETGRPAPPDVDARLDAYAAEFRERFVRQHGYFDSLPLIRHDREASH